MTTFFSPTESLSDKEYLSQKLDIFTMAILHNNGGSLCIRPYGKIHFFQKNCQDGQTYLCYFRKWCIWDVENISQKKKGCSPIELSIFSLAKQVIIIFLLHHTMHARCYALASSECMCHVPNALYFTGFSRSIFLHSEL